MTISRVPKKLARVNAYPDSRTYRKRNQPRIHPYTGPSKERKWPFRYNHFWVPRWRKSSRVRRPRGCGDNY